MASLTFQQFDISIILPGRFSWAKVTYDETCLERKGKGEFLYHEIQYILCTAEQETLREGK